MRAAFFGTPAAAIPALAALAGVARVEFVVTRPDKPRGRSGRPSPSPIKQAASSWGLDVEQPDAAAEVASRLAGCDVAVVAAYGQILPRSLLEVPMCGFVNLHFSVLPRWRGAAPVARAILAGDGATGVTIMLMDEGLDTGPVIATDATSIGDQEPAGTLTARLASQGAALLAEVLPEYVAGRIEPKPQDEAAATQAPKLTVAEARLDPSSSAGELIRAVRAFNPNPGAWVTIDGERLKIWTSAPSQDASVARGELQVVDGRLLMGADDRSIELVEVQEAGRSRMAGTDWARGKHGSAIAVDQAQ